MPKFVIADAGLAEAVEALADDFVFNNLENVHACCAFESLNLFRNLRNLIALKKILRDGRSARDERKTDGNGVSAHEKSSFLSTGTAMRAPITRAPSEISPKIKKPKCASNRRDMRGSVTRSKHSLSQISATPTRHQTAYRSESTNKIVAITMRS